MADPVRKHDAFISYHSASSRPVAVFLQQQLERVARRSVGDSALRLFRDQTALTYSDLGEALQRELRASHRFLLVLHRSTRDSRWVDEEVRYWLAHGGEPSRMILVRADPGLDLSWDDERRGFRHEELLPASLRGLYRSEPLWIDLSERRFGRPRADHGELARLCATLLDEDPATVLQREVQEQRTRQRRLGAALTGVSLLLVVAVVASVLAVLGGREARRQTVEAEAQSQAAEALLVGARRPDEAVALAVGAARRSSSRSVRAALLSVSDRNRRLSRLLPVDDVLGAAPDDLAFDQTGRRLAAWRDDRGVPRLGVWAVDSGEVLSATHLLQVRGPVTDLRLVSEDLAASCTSGGALVHRLAPGTSREVLRLDGTSCLLRPFRGGVLLVASGGSGPARAAVVDELSGRWRTYDDVAFAGTHPAADAAVVRVAGQGHQVVTAGLGVRGLAAPADVLSGEVVHVDRASTVTLQGRDGRRWSGRAGGAGAYWPVPRDALAAAPAAAGQDRGHVWVTRDGRLATSTSAATLDLSGLRARPEQRPAREVELHVSAGGQTALVLFRSTLEGFSDAAVVQLTGAAPRRLSRIERVQDVLVRGHEDALLFDGDLEGHLVDGSTGEVERVPGATYFDASGERAVAMGSALQLRLPRGEVVALDEDSDARAVAFTDDSTALAVARPAGPVALYSTAPEQELPPAAAVTSTPSSRTGSFGAITYTGSDGSVLRARGGATGVAYREAPGEASRVVAVSPEGDRAVLALTRSGQALGEVTRALVSVDGGASPVALGEHCPSATAADLAFLPGPGFATRVEDAEAARLVDLSGAGGGPTLRDCETGEDVPVPLGTTVLDHQVDASGGRIVWRQGEDDAQVTTWTRGRTSSLRTAVLPGSAGRQVSVSDDGRHAVAWATSGGSATLLQRRQAGTWSATRQVRTGLERIAAAGLAGGLLAVVDADGRAGVVDAGSGRLVLRTSVPTERPGAVVAGRVRVDADGALVVRVHHAEPEDGTEPQDTVVRVPVSVEQLREGLCAKAPSLVGCR